MRWLSRLTARGFRPWAVIAVAAVVIVTALVWVDIAGRPSQQSLAPYRAPAAGPSGAGTPSTQPIAPSPRSTPTASPSRSAVPQSDSAPASTWKTASAVRVDNSWVNQNAARTGIPARALTAYADAQLITNTVEPGCHLPWTMLAGIGLVESGHGSHGGAALLPSGATTVRILGPPLDGTHGNIAIPATPNGVRFDGDPKWDHAVGPMQFIPSTWIHWEVSVNTNSPDPNNIDDAALTAARYLCAAGGDLATAAGWRAAISAYNAPPSYTEKVVQAATNYARAALG